MNTTTRSIVLVMFTLATCSAIFLSYEAYIQQDRGMLPMLLSFASGITVSVVVYLLMSGSAPHLPALDDSAEVVTTIYPWGHAVEADHPLNDKSWGNIISLIHANLNVGVKVTLDFIPPSK